ncbi:hypothetical protein BABA_25631 [Neobacillus bataviensis LMG 21833]|uniref:SCP2 domain-containing protein n=1 Tax=Neobacillus bataviensis LMG 21833 TaxID=1117379 RepID=K6CQR7_9BACI|nr:hypothetical protein [Neobacillus bataviensis]EKN62592.1 hypothetical protein BABA_25631 [Neobacillus bataviensis LMG 21833]
MIEAVKTFLVKIKEQGHVLPLIHQADVQINLRCEEQTIQLMIKNGTIMSLQNSEAQPTKYEITGTPAAMKKLLEGTEWLRVLEQQRQLKVTAPLRTTLLLESLFFLTKAQNHPLAKII